MDTIIRAVKWDDFGDVTKNYYSFYEEVKSDHDFGIIFHNSQPDINAEISWFSNLIVSVNAGLAIAVVAERSGKVVGLCDVHNLRPGTELSHIGVLGISIIKEYRSMGIGTLLMEEALKLSKHKFEIIILDVFETNLRAIHLYEKLGFKKYKHMPKEIKRNGRYIGVYGMYLEL